VEQAEEGGSLSRASPMPAVAEPRVRPGFVSRFARGFNYEERSAYLFLLPLTIVLGAVAVFPVVYAFYLSLFRLKLTQPARVPFVGAGNYLLLLQEPGFWAAVGRTAYFTVICVVTTSIIALAVALLLNESFRGRRL
jgi:ABC-type sugar transport system permease subunit